MKLTIDEAKRHRANLGQIAASQNLPDEAAMVLGALLDKVIGGKDVDLPKKYLFLMTLDI